MTGAVDIHAHVVPADFPRYACRHADHAWPSMCHVGCGHWHIMIRGNVFRTVSEASWDAARRIADMDAAGIAVQALSPMPELLSYWFEADDAVAMAEVVNGSVADMVDARPGRFVGLGMVPLQAPDRAVEVLQALMRDGRFRGIEIGTNVNGVPVGNERFALLFDLVQRRVSLSSLSSKWMACVRIGAASRMAVNQRKSALFICRSGGGRRHEMPLAADTR
ncbi:amidohydrolase family protein [Xanthobacter autotrophicus]|uniref:amidohydrolase family protein n=1 Tax=Xanthobacter autotrophicus TaxID=280 RepID=UPI00372C968F